VADRSARETDMERREIEADRRCSRKKQPVQVTHEELKKKQVKNKQKFVHDFLKSFPFCLKIELPVTEIKQKATAPHIHMSL